MHLMEGFCTACAREHGADLDEEVLSSIYYLQEGNCHILEEEIHF